MKILVLEYLCGGCWADPSLSISLAKEGWMMLKAVLEDMQKISELEISTTWDDRLGDFPIKNIPFTGIPDPHKFENQFVTLLDKVDAVYLIAPEMDQSLLRLVSLVEHSRTRLIGPNSKVVTICSDKIKTKQHLRHHGILTPRDHPGYHAAMQSSQLASSNIDLPAFPFVIKPVDGAGSVDNWCIKNMADLQAYLENHPHVRENMMCEEYLEGNHYSVGVIVNHSGHVDILPLASQHLKIEQKMNYQGGHLPVKEIDPKLFYELAWKCIEAVEFPRGYLGIDMIAPDHQPDRPVVIEINPRLTTSYVGYRQHTLINLMHRMLSRENNLPAIPWKSNEVHWSVHDDFFQ